MVNVMGSAAQWEPRIISQRTKDALAVKRAQGVRLGRPSTLDPELVARIVREREGGASLAAIASALADEGVPTAHGGALVAGDDPEGAPALEHRECLVSGRCDR